MSINAAILSGTIMNIPPPEYVYYPNGDIKVSFLIEQEGKRKISDGSIYTSLEYFTIVAWNNDVGNLEKIVKENNIVLIYGKLKMVEVKDKNSVSINRRIIVVADNIKLIEKAK